MGTKYRDIADGNPLGVIVIWVFLQVLETKYRDIADGNTISKTNIATYRASWKPSTAI